MKGEVKLNSSSRNLSTSRKSISRLNSNKSSNKNSKKTLGKSITKKSSKFDFSKKSS